ncbi:DUF1049 domain-containing protein [Amycolatopsis rhizosphaerae]|uniref:DUF1049 domain-containing protein n=1 Tax=Amycolatopsis rhizosphaerae TaxID=2053003 RepID=A0A558B7Q3_9PSEU|nr:DUF1049 domain-containing protein [Amycolatopsis rhizosphaerae]TVT32541.1 DUF1049 domain-containing protein [Amycolatopsis rhizosphaerae]
MSQRPPSSTSDRVRANTRLIVAVVLTVIALVFILQNRQTVQIKLFIPTVSGPLWAALAAVGIVGLLVGFALGHHRRR